MTEMIFGTLGGLGLFLYGMIQMSEGLRKTAGTKLKSILESMTKNRIVACSVGAGITALIQSSSASTVMIVGFVNAGLLTLKQAISVIIGTNIGTTATAWLVSMTGFEFKITAYALPAVAAGVGLQMFGRSRTAKNVGEIIIGFGILFIGIDFMKGAFDGLGSSPETQAFLAEIANQPMLAIVAGMILTMLIQSSSAAVASIQLLAMSGAFGTDWNVALHVAIPFTLGSNIGTTITAQLAALRTNLNARRAAWAHTVFNVFGAFIWFFFIGWVCLLVNAIAPWELGPTTIAASIAAAHTIIKVLNASLFLPMTGVLEKAVVKLVPEKEGDLVVRPTVLEKHLLATPELALDQARSEIVRMAQASKRAVIHSIDGLLGNNRRKLDAAMTTEEVTDTLQYEITSYLAAISEQELSEETSAQLPVLMHIINDLERVGDHAVNIVELAERKMDERLTFSDFALDEIAELREHIEHMCDVITTALADNDSDAAESALVDEEALNRMQREFRRSHVRRMSEGLCTPATGLIFIDLVDNVEKAGDHLANIAQSVIGGLQWDGYSAPSAQASDEDADADEIDEDE